MATPHDEFLIRRNIDRFTRLLRTEADEAKRAVLEELLSEEKAKMLDHCVDRKTRNEPASPN